MPKYTIPIEHEGCRQFITHCNRCLKNGWGIFDWPPEPENKTFSWAVMNHCGYVVAIITPDLNSDNDAVVVVRHQFNRLRLRQTDRKGQEGPIRVYLPCDSFTVMYDINDAQQENMRPFSPYHERPADDSDGDNT